MGDVEARANLRGVLHNLRQLVGPYLTIERQTVAFNTQQSHWLDIAYLNKLPQFAETAVGDEEVMHIQQAVDLYHGDLLQGLYVRQAPVFEEWLLTERERISQIIVQGLYVLAAYYRMRGNYTEAIRYTTRMLSMDPWHEEAHRQLMLLFALAGERSAALRQYESCRMILLSELGVEPSDDTNELYQRILHRSWSIHDSHHLPKQRPNLAMKGMSARKMLPFVGREVEYAYLFRLWEAVQHSTMSITLIAGEAGIGKTRLINEVLHHTVGLGAVVLRSNCQDFAHNVPYQPIAEILQHALQSLPDVFETLSPHVLTELVRIMPVLYDQHSVANHPLLTNDETSRIRLFEAIAQTFCALQKHYPQLILFIDDLHFLDQPTSDLLRYLIVRMRHLTFWIIGAYQDTDIHAQHPLQPFLYDLDRSKLGVHMQLHALSDETTNILVTQLYQLDSDAHQALKNYLDVCAEGHPFILEEVIYDLEQRSILQQGARSWQLTIEALDLNQLYIPAAVKSMVHNRLRQLPSTATMILEAAACLGHTFEAELLCQLVSTELQHSDDGVALLLAKKLLYETFASSNMQANAEYRQEVSNDKLVSAPLCYTFSYPMIQSVMYANLSYHSRQRIIDKLTSIFHPTVAVLPFRTRVRKVPLNSLNISA